MQTQVLSGRVISLYLAITNSISRLKFKILCNHSKPINNKRRKVTQIYYSYLKIQFQSNKGKEIQVKGISGKYQQSDKGGKKKT